MNWIGMFPGQGSQEIGMGKDLLKTHGDLLIDTAANLKILDLSWIIPLK